MRDSEAFALGGRRESGAESRRSRVARFLSGATALAFGTMTLLVGGRAVVALGSADSPADVAPFVLIFNATAGFLYVATGLAALTRRPIAAKLALGLALATAIVGAAFAVQWSLGGPGAAKTAVALAIRTAFWAAQWQILRRLVFAAPRATVR